MKPHRMLAATVLAATFALGVNYPALAADAHSHETAAPAALTLDHGKQWATDAPLRQYMSEIRALMADRLGPIHAGTLPARDFSTLGTEVENKVGGIIAECKLAPEADAQLHVIVADLVAGADIMQGKASGDAAEGAHKVVTALNAYAHYFDHPGFEPLG
jgi:hypothetical protein